MARDFNNFTKNALERLSSMLQAGRWTDCKFLVGTELQVVEAHKSILASASPVFEAMFFGEMAESSTEISVPDIQPAAFKAMLQYIYTDNIKLTSLDEAFNLYYAANKYILSNLEVICTSYVESILTTDNVCQVYEFASMFNEKSLVDKCLGFLRNNLENTLKSRNIVDAQLSTLVMIFSLDSCTKCNALDLFKVLERYVKAQEKRVESSTNCETDCESLSNKSSESSVLKDMVVVNGDNNAKDSKEASGASLSLDKGTAPSLTGSKEKPNIHSLLQKIHFLTLTPQQFATGPAISGLLTESEAYAIIMNIASDETNIPLPNGFSTYRYKNSDYRLEDKLGQGKTSKLSYARQVQARGKEVEGFCDTCGDYCGHFVWQQ